jgi:hypothetical protein
MVALPNEEPSPPPMSHLYDVAPRPLLDLCRLQRRLDCNEKSADEALTFFIHSGVFLSALDFAQL